MTHVLFPYNSNFSLLAELFRTCPPFSDSISFHNHYILQYQSFHNQSSIHYFRNKLVKVLLCIHFSMTSSIVHFQFYHYVIIDHPITCNPSILYSSTLYLLTVQLHPYIYLKLFRTPTLTIRQPPQ